MRMSPEKVREHLVKARKAFDAEAKAIVDGLGDAEETNSEELVKAQSAAQAAREDFDAYRHRVRGEAGWVEGALESLEIKGEAPDDSLMVPLRRLLTEVRADD